MVKRNKNQNNKNLLSYFVALFYFSFIISSYWATSYVITDTSSGTSIPVTSSGAGSFRASLNSTSVDWEAVTGLNLREYNIKFIDTNVTGFNGWELYYLDSFPCYGYGQYVRIWLNTSDSEGTIRLNCVRAPKEIMLAMREAKKDQPQAVTTTLLKCKVYNNLSVALDKCEKKTWSEFSKEHSEPI